MADTQANRMATGPSVYIAATSVALPATSGASLTWTDWTQLPSIAEDITIEPVVEFESFHPANYLHPTDADLVAIGVNTIEFTIKETALASLAIGLNTTELLTTGSSGVATDLQQPTLTSHFPLKQLALVYSGPVSGGWGQIHLFPRVRRTTCNPVEWTRGEVRKYRIGFSAFALDTTGDKPTGMSNGECDHMYEFVAAG